MLASSERMPQDNFLYDVMLIPAWTVVLLSDYSAELCKNESLQIRPARPTLIKLNFWLPVSPLSKK